MCLAVCYSENSKTIITHFPQAKATLPIRTKIQTIQPVMWGKRMEESGNFPVGGWASLESIKQGKWDKFFPKSVKIPIKKFMEQDIEGRSLWFDVTEGNWLQGLLLEKAAERRVYIVTITPELPGSPYPRWPRILCD